MGGPDKPGHDEQNGRDRRVWVPDKRCALSGMTAGLEVERPAGLQPTVSGDSKPSALALAGRGKLLGRQKLGQVRRLEERADLDPARA